MKRGGGTFSFAIMDPTIFGGNPDKDTEIYDIIGK